MTKLGFIAAGVLSLFLAADSAIRAIDTTGATAQEVAR